MQLWEIEDGTVSFDPYFAPRFHYPASVASWIDRQNARSTSQSVYLSRRRSSSSQFPRTSTKISFF
ncbi:hypothetical protein QT972_21645 [Microcoleus sp. herbarium7]|uniref:hypothetical protein n=1 Tax=unclassified Microcoleus TaxID=2642155 RepID=UPI002FD3344A